MSDESDQTPERPETPRPGTPGEPAEPRRPAEHAGPERPEPPFRPERSRRPEPPARPELPAAGPMPPTAAADAEPSAPGRQQPSPDVGRPAGSASGVTGRQRLKAGLWPPRVSRAQLIVALLLFVLGLGLAIQVRSTSDTSALRGARQEDLVRILDELDNRSQRLGDEQRRLEEQRTELENSSDQAEEARKQTEQKAEQLGVLAGTVAVEGPGITLTVNDPQNAVEADMLLDALQELRAAGAEAIQINDVRVVADTYFTQGSGGVQIDGHKVNAPYRFKVIGNPQDLEPALNIPGGVVQTLEKEQATADVARSEKIVVDALRPSEQPDYAQSSTR
ncbi:DUF881 domain-containing protein [Actinacidiphila glaucinigra]|uniref:DUF881 domain-containing protein n=1 Tax=Actinacidiphila glaucinigra TaxID=235986 RepID=UPI002DDB0E44|nr:DUF881 domain-containing protein [Actinacidiphila glaucinigra]WSD63420.1 DUF881 domain-containing protein [Actinacidiphila glaucinigra]